MHLKLFRNNSATIALLFALLIVVTSCKSKKAVLGPTVPETVTRLNHHHVLKDVEGNQLLFKTFSAKAKSSVAINRDSYDATLNIKIKHAEAIWISITTLFGIEAARVFITPGRFKMMNRLNGTYLDQPLSFLNQFGSEEITFDNLQAMMVGNMISQTLSYTEEAEKNADGYLLKGSHNDLDFSVQTNTDYKIITCLLSTFDGARKVQTEYTNFSMINKKSVPQEILLSARSAALKLDLQLKYNRIALNEALEMPFTIPSKYKELRDAQ